MSDQTPELTALEKHACPACGARAEWDPGEQRLNCPYCGTEAPYEIDVDSGEIHLKRMAAAAIHADTYRNLTIRPSYSGETFKHVLVPVWLLSYDYGSRKFQVVVNGYSGRIAGKYPQSWWKILALLAALALIAAVLVGLDALQF